MRLEFHAEFGKRPAGDDSNLIADARLYEARAVNDPVHRPGTECFDVRTRSVRAAGLFGNGLTKIPTTAIITVPPRFFRATYDKVDFFRTQLESIQQGI